MNRYIVLLLSFCIFIITGCSSDKSPPPYKPGGIVVKYNAESQLNIYDDSSHSIMLAVYQLDNINSFHQLTKDLAGTQKLLNVSKFDSSVLGVDTFFINPSESGVFKLDRLQNSSWIGVVAGYYNLTAGQVTKEFEITNAKKPLNINLIISTDSLQEVPNK